VSWGMVPASELMLKRGGSVNPAKFPDETFDLLSIPAFDRGVVDIQLGAEIGSSKSIVQPNDVLLSKIIPHIRRCWVVPPKRENRQIGSGEWIIFRDTRFDPSFLKHFLTSNIFHSQFMSTVAGVGGSLVRARPAFVEKIEIPLPYPDDPEKSLKEQKRVAAILDKADGIRRKRQQAIQLADDFLRSVFLDMFGDPVTNPKGWEVKPLGLLCDVSSGSTPSRKIDSYYGGDIPWVKTTEVNGYEIVDTEEKITQEGLDNSSCKINPKGSLVLAMYGQGKTRGKVGVLGIDAATNQACAVLKPSSKINMSYLYQYLLLSYESLRALGQGGGQPNLNGAIVKEYSILLPPYELQEKFVKIANKIKSVNDKNLSLTSISYDGFKSLSQKAFKGEL